MAGEVWPIVPGIPVPFEGVCERVEGGRREAALVDVGEWSAEPAESQPEEEDVGWGRLEFGDEGEGVEAAAVVVDLALDALELAAVDIVPAEWA